jgi:hypothetical protein
MSLYPEIDHFIPLSQAVDMTTLYRENKEGILASQYQNTNILPICESFNRSIFDTILAQQNCEGIRLYFGMDQNLNVRMIIVGVNGDNEDMVPEVNSIETEDDNIGEDGIRCPTNCPPPSVLNE